MQKRTLVRFGLFFGGALCVAGVGAVGGCRLAHDMVQVVPSHSIAPGRDGIAWVACRHTVAARQSNRSERDRRAFCQDLAEEVCHGSATYLDRGTGQAQANFYRERFQCARTVPIETASSDGATVLAGR